MGMVEKFGDQTAAKTEPAQENINIEYIGSRGPKLPISLLI